MEFGHLVRGKVHGLSQSQASSWLTQFTLRPEVGASHSVFFPQHPTSSSWELNQLFSWPTVGIIHSLFL